MIRNEPPKELFSPEGGPNVVQLEIRLCLDENKNVWSLHLISPKAEQKLLTWPGGGTNQVGHALLTETLRREAFNTLLAIMSSEKPGLVKDWFFSDDDTKKVIENEIALLVHNVISVTTKKMAPDTVKEILTMLSRQTAVNTVNPSEDAAPV